MFPHTKGEKMPESQNENVKEVVQPTEGAVVENTQASEPISAEEQRPSSEDKNWKEVREIMQQQKQKIAELETKLGDKENVSLPKEEDPLEQLSDEDIVTVGDAKKMVASMARKYASEVVEERQRKQAIDRVPSQFGDYNEIISLVDEYVKENPTAENAILNSPNPRLTAYELVKSSTLYQRKIAKKETSDNVQKAIDNSKKPVSSQTIGTTSPLNDMNKYEKMTKERAAEIRKLSEEYASKR